MEINKKLTLILLFSVAVGICAGAFFEVFIEGRGKEQLMEILSVSFSGAKDQAFEATFFNCVKSWLLIAIVVFLCPVLPPLCIPCMFLPFFKGITLGFSATMLVETFGIKGTWYIISTMLPHSIIQLPVLCLMIALSVTAASALIRIIADRGHRNISKKNLPNLLRQYALLYSAGIIIILLSCLIEALLN